MDNPVQIEIKIERWREGPVDCKADHFELRFGSAEHGSWDDFLPIALIGPPESGSANVQFLVEPTSSNAKALSKVKGEIDFYLIEKGERNPWLYAQHHCGTMSNVYSNVHWSYWPIKPAA